MSRLSQDIQDKEATIAELIATIRALTGNGSDIDAPVISRLVNLGRTMEKNGIDIMELNLAEIEDIARFLSYTISNNYTLQSISTFLDQIRDQGYRDFNLLLAALENLERKGASDGSGIGVCWATEENQSGEILFDVVSFDDDYLIVPAWDENRQDEILQMPGMGDFFPNCEDGCFKNDQELSNFGLPLRNFAQEQAQIGGIPCYLSVRYFAHSKLDNVKSLLFVQRFFVTAVRYINRDYFEWRLETGRDAITINR
jgi:hypothetical protein